MGQADVLQPPRKPVLRDRCALDSPLHPLPIALIPTIASAPPSPCSGGPLCPSALNPALSLSPSARPHPHLTFSATPSAVSSVASMPRRRGKNATRRMMTAGAAAVSEWDQYRRDKCTGTPRGCDQQSEHNRSGSKDHRPRTRRPPTSGQTFCAASGASGSSARPRRPARRRASATTGAWATSARACSSRRSVPGATPAAARKWATRLAAPWTTKWTSQQGCMQPEFGFTWADGSKCALAHLQTTSGDNTQASSSDVPQGTWLWRAWLRHSCSEHWLSNTCEGGRQPTR